MTAIWAIQLTVWYCVTLVGRKGKECCWCECACENWWHIQVSESWVEQFTCRNLASTSISVLCPRHYRMQSWCGNLPHLSLSYLPQSHSLSFPLLSCFTAHYSTLCYLRHHNKLSVRIADKAAGVEVLDDAVRSRWKHKLEHSKHAILIQIQRLYSWPYCDMSTALLLDYTVLYYVAG
jgi:hypothetical protein